MLHNPKKMSSSNISFEERAKIVNLHEDGMNISQIAKELGCTRNTVRRWIIRFEKDGRLVDKSRRRKKPYVIDETLTKEMVKTYAKEPYTPTKVFAKRYNCSARTVRRALNRAGLIHKNPSCNSCGVSSEDEKLDLSTSRCNMVKTALVILAQGAEEMETVITVDMLRRGGVEVTLAGLDGDAPVLCSRNVTLVPNKSLADALAERPQYDALILPGGLEGSDRLSKSPVVGTLLKEHEKAGKIVAAICAAPTAFVAHGIAHGKRVTSYPSTKNKIPADNYTYVEGERVVIDGNIVTSRGPGTAYWFGLSLIEQLVDKDTAAQVEKGMIISGY